MFVARGKSVLTRTLPGGRTLANRQVKMRSSSGAGDMKVCELVMVFNTAASLLCVLLHSLHMPGKYVAVQGSRSLCCVMRFIVVSFVHVPTAAKRHVCRLDVGWIIVWGLAIYLW